MKKEVVIVGALRSPIGSLGGIFKNTSAIELGVAVIKQLLEDCQIKPSAIDEVIFGNVIRSGLGQNVARQIAIGANIPEEKTAFSVDFVCGSGMKAITLGAQSIMCGESDIVIAGGTENMTQAPYLIKDHRFGGRLGNSTLYDTVVDDGLTDVFDKIHMGITAENIAEKYGISREEQDQFALLSQKKAEEALNSNQFAAEIAPVTITKRRRETEVICKDEYPKLGSTIEKLQKLRPAFIPKEGSVTSGNASGINDGAAAVLLMSKEKAIELQLPIIGTIVSYANAGVSPKVMGLGPIPATQKALKKANITVSDLDLIESNEAFAVQSLAVTKELGFDPDIVNVNGGAIALGHPIGASGTRIVVTLLHEMKKRNAHYGLATLCIGGGQGAALIVKGS